MCVNLSCGVILPIYLVTSLNSLDGAVLLTEFTASHNELTSAILVIAL